jgi:hypothetical protein
MTDHVTVPGSVADGPRIRVSDAERAGTVEWLQQALVEGRLDLAETDERVRAAFAARYDSDLQPLLADLPPQRSAPNSAPSWSALCVSAVWRARILVLGAETGGHTPPTPQQCRIAATLAALGLVWTLICAFVGAAIVA